jgi:hypothetical protein
MTNKERLSSGQLAILEEFKNRPLILKSVPEYWDPHSLANDQIDRLLARGFIREQDSNTRFYEITDKGAARIGMERCSCGCPTHPQEAACIHCGKTKDWAK